MTAVIQAPGERCELLESYPVDTDPRVFLQMHQLYETARREQRPVKCIVYREGEPPTIEDRLPTPLAPTPRRPGAGGAPRKLRLAEIRKFLKKQGPVGTGKTQATRAREMGVTIRTLQNYQHAARLRVTLPHSS